MKKKISFIIGSGVSRYSGVPSTEDITNQILTDENVFRHTDGSYNFNNHSNELNDAYLKAIIPFLNLLKEEINSYFSNHCSRTVNYEDIYYMASQIYDAESGEYDNPSVQPLIDKILPFIKSKLVHIPYLDDLSWPIDRICEESMNYIRDTVWYMLSRQPTRIDQFDFLKDCVESGEFANIDIFTLNHDTIIEQYLNDKNISFVDGFSEKNNNLRTWNPELYNDTPEDVPRLFKLHGSVN